MKSNLFWQPFFLVAFFSLLASAQPPESKSAPTASEVRHGQERESTDAPVFVVANGLNADGSLLLNYKRGLRYVTEEIKAVLSGKSHGGLTWTQDPPLLFEDVTTNATQRDKNPIENTWGALHEYHHVFQMAHCDTKQERTSDKHINSWIAEGMATYSSAKFMENLGLIDFKEYMLKLRTSGGNIGRPGINDFLASTKDWRLDEESYWDCKGPTAQVYYMLGAWATAYLVYVEGVEEKTVLKYWYHDIPRIGKSAAFEKHMGLSLTEFYKKFDPFIRMSDDEVMKIFN